MEDKKIHWQIRYELPDGSFHQEVEYYGTKDEFEKFIEGARSENEVKKTNEDLNRLTAEVELLRGNNKALADALNKAKDILFRVEEREYDSEILRVHQQMMAINEAKKDNTK